MKEHKGSLRGDLIENNKRNSSCLLDKQRFIFWRSNCTSKKNRYRQNNLSKDAVFEYFALKKICENR